MAHDLRDFRVEPARGVLGQPKSDVTLSAISNLVPPPIPVQGTDGASPQDKVGVFGRGGALDALRRAIAQVYKENEARDRVILACRAEQPLGITAAESQKKRGRRRLKVTKTKNDSISSR